MPEKNMMFCVIDMVAEVGANMICESLKNWRFYFDDADRAAVKLKLKNLMFGLVNGRRI